MLRSLALLSLPVAQALGEGLVDVRIFPAGKYTRLVIEAEQLPEYRMSLVRNPMRLVLDFKSEGGERLLDNIRDRDLSGVAYLEGIRAARFDRERLRIVFDLADEVSYSLFSLDPVDMYGNRIVLDITPKAEKPSNYGLLKDLGFVALERGRPALAPGPDASSVFHVVIDPGHGGEDPGAVNKSGLKEKHINLDISRQLARRINQIPAFKASMTRDEDIFIPLASRVRIAQERDADLFISIHADSFTSPRPRGSSTFVLSQSGASSKLAASLARHANLSDKIGGINTTTTAHEDNVQAALTGIFKDGKERASRSYAELALDHLATLNHTHGDSVHKAGFAVLKSPSVPSVLIEVGFISNPDDARLLSTKGYRKRVAEQIAASVVEYRERQYATAARQ